MTAVEWVTAPAPSNALRDGTLDLAGRGNSAIRRAAIVVGSGCAAGSSGSSAINDANRCVAVSPGNAANLAASCQGSMSSRASAERTLSNIPFLSSPIGANRKSSNSGPRREAEAEYAISTTGCCRPYRTYRPDNEAWALLPHLVILNICTAVSRVRLGNYLNRRLSGTVMRRPLLHRAWCEAMCGQQICC